MSHSPVAAASSDDRKALFGDRHFRLLWTSQAISQIGDGLTKVALLWFVYHLTGSAFKMTLIGLVQTIPPLVLSPLIGVYLDRLPKKPVLVTLDVLRACSLALIPLLHAWDALTLEILFLLVFCTALFSTAFGPALAASLPLLVKPASLVPANSLLQSTTNLGILVGPAMGGIFIAWLGTENVLYVDAATFLLSALCLLPIQHAGFSTAPPLAQTTAKVSQDLVEGLRFVFKARPLLRSLLITTAFYTLGASALVYVLPLFANTYLNADPVWLGWLWSCMGAGMLATSLGLSWLPPLSQKGRSTLLAGSLLLGGSALQVLAQASSVGWGFFLVTLIGACTATFTPIAWSLIQETTPQHFMGRVFTLINTAAMAMASGGMVAFGVVADTVGAMAGIAMIGLVFLGTGGLVLMVLRPTIHHEPISADRALDPSDHGSPAPPPWQTAKANGATPLSIVGE